MRRMDEDGYSYDPYTPYQSPPYIPPINSVNDEQFFSDPYVYAYGGGGGGGDYQVTDDVQFFSDPYVNPDGSIGGLSTGVQRAGSGVSRLGPTASAQYYGAMNPFIRAGGLLSGRGRGAGAYRSGSIYQRGFTVDAQEALRRRKRARNRFTMG